LIGEWAPKLVSAQHSEHPTLRQAQGPLKSRNSVDHIAVSDDKVIEYNKIAASVTYDWDLEINNNHPASDDDILAAIQSIGAVGRE
jgi:hypothetical protein